MAGCVEKYKRWAPFTRDKYPGEYPGTGINWAAFWWMFGVMYSRYFMQIMTPWFVISLSSGRPTYWEFNDWFGVQLNWSHVKNWRMKEGGLMFTKGDTSLSFKRRALQEMY